VNAGQEEVVLSAFNRLHGQERRSRFLLPRQSPSKPYNQSVNLSPNFVTDDTGKRTAVLLPIESYEALLEDLQDLSAIADRRSESTVSHAEFLAELRADGLLQD
jgi:hypothetical protein